ncbi:mitochondrial carrier, partial [Martensiomyces pterosporus]
LLYENRTLASAITAAVTGLLAGYPFDSLKTRMQTYHYPSLLTCARRSIAEEGIRGLYRGLVPPLLTTSAAKSMSFSVFEHTKQWLRRHDPYRSQKSSLGVPNFQRETVGSVALTAGLSGSVAGTVIAISCCPLELVKVQMQLASLLSKDVAVDGGAPPPAWAKSNLSVCREIVRRKGMFGLYSGLQLHIVRDLSGTAIYFASYETVKETLRRLNGSDTTGPLTHMLAGGICGVVSWLLIFPVDLIKSTMQSQVLKPRDAQMFGSSWQCMRDIYGRMGLSGLYRGVSVSLIRAFPLHGLNFVVYEWARASICRL